MPENDTGVKLVIYKKIVAGDLSKFTATSNITQSGGGARDLRFNPADQFLTVFRKMFPRVSDNGVLTGYFSWANHANTEVEIHPPTKARPNEVRIGRIHECFPTQYIPDNAHDCVLLLIMDQNNAVWPFFTSERSLRQDDWHPTIKNNILAGLSARRSPRTTAMGFIDLETGGSYTNGQ